MTPGAVHQLLPVLTAGDAIGEAAIQMRRLLRGLGFRSHIYARLIDRRLRGVARPSALLERDLGEADATIYHLSIGSAEAERFAGMCGRRLLYYHNISPADSVRPYSVVQAERQREGRLDLARLAPLVDAAMSPSEFSARELCQAGAKNVSLVQLPVNLQRLRPRPAQPVHPPVLLFVGRLAPHKQQHELVRILAAVRATAQPQARLLLAAGSAVPRYADAVFRWAATVGVSDAVDRLPTPCSDAALGSAYARASVFVSASDHEGFFVPAVEAMAFSVPIVAYARGATGETVGSGGLVLDHLDPLVWAEVINDIITGPSLRRRMIAAGAQRLGQFGDAPVQAGLRSSLASVGLTPPHH